MRATPHTQRTLQLPGGEKHRMRKQGTPSQSIACCSASPSCVPPPEGAGSECAAARKFEGRQGIRQTLASRRDVQGWPAAGPMPSTISRPRVLLLSFLLLGSTPVAPALDAWPGALPSERPVVPASQPNAHGETDQCHFFRAGMAYRELVWSPGERVPSLCERRERWWSGGGPWRNAGEGAHVFT